MTRRRLPVGGVQVFKTLRKEYDVYVDKTMHIYEMAEARCYQSVFLSRPRRFGKSLLCSTIDSLFRSEKELFEGLGISKTGWEWKEHPVIHLKLGEGNYTDNGIKVLSSTLNDQLDDISNNYNSTIEKNEIISVKFVRVIKNLCEKMGQVVIIID